MRRLTVAAALLCASVAHAGMRPAASGGSPIPPGALEAGFTTKTFETTSFSASTIDLQNSLASGFQWYMYRLSNFQADKTMVTLPGDGTVTVNDTSSYNAAISSATYVAGSQAFVGTAFGCGMYAEAEISFDPALVDTSKGWPSWWFLAAEHMFNISGKFWSGYESQKYEHYVEVDQFEALLGAGFVAKSYTGTVIDWYGTYGQTCSGFCSSQTDYKTNFMTLPPGNDWKTVWHRIAVRLVPATSTTKGSIRFYADDVPIRAGGDVTYTQFTNQAPPVTADATWRFGVVDQQHQVLILGATGPAPLNVRSVRVWQGAGRCNITN